jgi:hypothetical protein
MKRKYYSEEKIISILMKRDGMGIRQGCCHDYMELPRT